MHYYDEKYEIIYNIYYIKGPRIVHVMPKIEPGLHTPVPTADRYTS